MGLPVSLILIAIGAVLAFAVHQHPGASVDVHVVGWVLLAVGFVGLLLSLFLWERLGPGYWGWGRGPGPYDGPPGGGYARARVRAGGGGKCDRPQGRPVCHRYSYHRAS